MLGNTVIEGLSAFASSMLPIGIDAAIKSLIVLAVACVAVMFMRRNSAAARHHVLLLAMASLLALPILSAALPAWQILPAWLEVDQTEIVDEATAPSTATTPVVEVAPLPPDAQIPSESTDFSPPIFMPQPSLSGPNPSGVSSSIPVSAPPASLDVAGWILLLWVLGAALSLLPVLLGRASLGWIGHQSQRITDSRCLRLFTQLSQQLKLNQSVRLLMTDRRAIPMVWSTLGRNRLLLPCEALTWSTQRLRMVFLHELAHLKRRDCTSQTITQLACALYWFNPLAWLAARWMRAERERACDDLVLAHGSDPADYADELLQVATHLNSARRYQSAAIAMARKSGFESRMRAILDGTLNRKPLTRWVSALLAVSVLLLSAPVAMMHADEPEKIEDQVAVPDAELKEEELVEPEKPADPAAAIDPQQAIVLDPAIGWEVQNWGHMENKMATRFSVNTDVRPVRFEVFSPSALRPWVRRLDLPIHSDQYPILVLRYRATGIHTGWSWYGFWVGIGSGGKSVEMFEFVGDGKEQEIRRDLRETGQSGEIICGHLR